MTVSVERPTSLDVSRGNPRDVLYLKGNADTDGSLRAVPDVDSGDNWELQERLEGVWNTTGLQVAASTVHLGREVEISGAGDWLEQRNIDGETSIIPHIEFTDSGTDPLPHTITMSPKIVRQVVQPDLSSERISTVITNTLPSPINAFRTKLYYQIGSVGATAPVTLEVDKGGNMIFITNLPTSKFSTPNTENFVDLEGFFQANVGETLEITFTSDEIFSLKGNASDTVIWAALDLFLISEESMVTVQGGTSRFLTDVAEGHVISDVNGDIVLSGEIDS